MTRRDSDPHENAAKRQDGRLSDEDRRAVEAHYAVAVTRMIHEYDQRDRDFVMHISINGGLFIAAGFVVPYYFRGPLWPSVVAGFVLVLIGVIGAFVAMALVGSVRNFKFWQGRMGEHLARLEYAFLPDPVFGNWCRHLAYKPLKRCYVEDDLIEAIDRVRASVARSDACDAPDIPQNLVDFREALARTLVVVWALIAVGGGAAAAVSLLTMR